jgi:chaperonin GroES
MRHNHHLTALRLSSTAPSQQYTLDGQDIRGEITPLGNIVLVKVKETLTATTGGILLPDQAKERPTEGVVVCAGPGKIHPFTAVRIHNPIKEGMSVLYGKFDGRPVTYNGEECQVIRDDDVLLMYQGLTMKLDNVAPVRDYVLIEVEKPSSDDLQTTSGVVVAAQVLKDKAICEGRVVKVGEGRMASLGNLTPPPVQPGDYVKWKDYAGNEVKIEGNEYSLVKMVDLLATRTEAPK